jgi:hypothetical protein
MLTWQEKDLGWIARKMDNIQRRLDLKRGGKQTQKMQKEVLVRLDEMIKELENKQKQQQKGQPKPGEGQPKPGNGGECPEGDQPGNGPPKGSIPNGNPATDSALPSGQNQGDAEKKVADLAQIWGDLPEKDRARAMAELTRNMPPRYKEAIEAYFDKLQKTKDEK